MSVYVFKSLDQLLSEALESINYVDHNQQFLLRNLLPEVIWVTLSESEKLNIGKKFGNLINAKYQNTILFHGKDEEGVQIYIKL